MKKGGMNVLEIYIQKNHLNEGDTMNLLQGDAIVISDMCAHAADVWEDDAEMAVRWLKLQDGALL